MGKEWTSKSILKGGLWMRSVKNAKIFMRGLESLDRSQVEKVPPVLLNVEKSDLVKVIMTTKCPLFQHFENWLHSTLELFCALQHFTSVFEEMIYRLLYAEEK
ncbi:hypothetical protein V6N12_043061 [Hibiscus sabdariffa]|uniref:Uncharacterized protein n=1 Tax=Hibiscus sabdariffa TaxID=183260 RepID=A0ABR2DI42_9ROSI